jgi:hypothetical protein
MMISRGTAASGKSFFANTERRFPAGTRGQRPPGTPESGFVFLGENDDNISGSHIAVWRARFLKAAGQDTAVCVKPDSVCGCRFLFFLIRLYILILPVVLLKNSCPMSIFLNCSLSHAIILLRLLILVSV